MCGLLSSRDDDGGGAMMMVGRGRRCWFARYANRDFPFPVCLTKFRGSRSVMSSLREEKENDLLFA